MAPATADFGSLKGNGFCAARRGGQTHFFFSQEKETVLDAKEKEGIP